MSSDVWYQAFDHPPPSLDDFQGVIEQAVTSLPVFFQNLIKGVVIKVEDFPDTDVEKAMALESPYDLLGLYHGVPFGHDSGFDAPRQEVDMIFLYRRPILAFWCDHDLSLSAIIKNTLIHEIGHHVGLSDEDMDRIEFGDDGLDNEEP